MDKKKKIIIGLGATIIVIMALITFLYFDGIKAPSNKSEEVIVQIENGTSRSGILDVLEEKGLIKNRFAADIFVKFNHFNTLQANTYVLNKNMDLETILTIMNTGDFDYLLKTKFTIKDGTTIPECAKAIGEALGLNEAEVLNVWQDESYLRSLIDEYWFITDEILNPEIVYPLEGYLAAETYFVTDMDPTVETVTKYALDQMDANLKEYKDKIENMNMTVHEFLSFAAVVQGEAGDDESAMIAGVFINRLNQNMLLQSDATVNYANQTKTIDVTYTHLSVDSKYNTYKYTGIPVGPICSVSTKTIDACLNYKENDYLYFVADAWGSHPTGEVFYSKTYEEHMKKVNELKAKE